MIKGKMTLSGLDGYLEKIQKAGNDIAPAVEEALLESVKPIQEDIVAWAKRHEFTGVALEDAEIKREIKRDGNMFSTDAGIIASKESGTYEAWRIVFVEYGTPRMAADPGIRTAFDRNKSKVKQIQKKVLSKWGIPND